MNTFVAAELLESIQKQDEEFLAKKLETTGGTFCCACKANKPIALYPFYHRFGRQLCDDCRKDYRELLRGIGALSFD